MFPVPVPVSGSFSRALLPFDESRGCTFHIQISSAEYIHQRTYPNATTNPTNNYYSNPVNPTNHY